MKTQFTVRVLAGGRITVPIAIRDRRGWRPGDEFVFELHSDGVMMRLASDAAAPPTKEAKPSSDSQSSQ